MHATEELVHPSDKEASREDAIYTPKLLGTGQRNSGLKLDIKNLLMVLRTRVEQTDWGSHFHFILCFLHTCTLP